LACRLNAIEVKMSGSPGTNPVLVVGGGIGGLTTALALSRKGIPVRVLEQAAEFKEIGAGIQLGPNVFRMFELLGLTEAIFGWRHFRTHWRCGTR
jgi:3-hydroxybenzoate 6-monooxygenase